MNQQLIKINAEEFFIDGVKWADLNKQITLGCYQTECREGRYSKRRALIQEVYWATPQTFEEITNDLMSDRDWLADKGGPGSTWKPSREVDPMHFTEEEFRCWWLESYSLGILLTDGEDSIVINPEGFNYARYVGLVPEGYKFDRESGRGRSREIINAQEAETTMTVITIAKTKTVAIGPKAILAMPIENGSAEQYRRYLWEVHRGAEPIEVATKLGVVASKWCRPTREKVMKHLGELVSAIRNGYSLEFQGIGDHGQMLERYAVAKVAGRF